jgi:hypothetical protein
MSADSGVVNCPEIVMVGFGLALDQSIQQCGGLAAAQWHYPELVSAQPSFRDLLYFILARPDEDDFSGPEYDTIQKEAIEQMKSMARLNDWKSAYDYLVLSGIFKTKQGAMLLRLVARHLEKQGVNLRTLAWVPDQRRGELEVVMEAEESVLTA